MSEKNGWIDEQVTIRRNGRKESTGKDVAQEYK